MSDITRQRWYVVGPPWLNSDQVPYVVAGHPDPHVGTFVCDLESIAADPDRQIPDAYEIGNHICKL